MAGVTKVLVCRGTSCASQHGQKLLCDLEELCAFHEHVACEPRRCMGWCGRGPNVQVWPASAAQPSMVSGVRTYEDVERCAAVCAPGLSMNRLQREVAKLKFRTRRAADVEERQKLLGEAFAKVGGGPLPAEDVQRRRLLGELLLLRAGDGLAVGAGAAAAAADAKQAAELLPEWPRAHIAVADALQAEGDAAAAAAVLRAALGSVREHRRGVLTRRLAELAGEADAEEPDFRRWRVDASRRLNHNSLQLSLSFESPAALAAAPAMDVFHVDVGAETPSASSPSSPSTAAAVRSYTPASSTADFREGRLELVVKVYPDGVLTPHLASLSAGSFLNVSAPVETLDASDFPGILVVAGGSAVTVALQLCEAVLRRHPKRGRAHLVLCNRTADDVLLMDRLDALLVRFAGFHLVHCLSGGPPPLGASAGGRPGWRLGGLDARALAGVEARLKAVVSGPPGLCRAAAELIGRLGLGGGVGVVILDEVPQTAASSEALGAPAVGDAAGAPTVGEAAGASAVGAVAEGGEAKRSPPADAALSGARQSGGAGSQPQAAPPQLRMGAGGGAGRGAAAGLSVDALAAYRPRRCCFARAGSPQ